MVVQVGEVKKTYKRGCMDELLDDSEMINHYIRTSENIRFTQDNTISAEIIERYITLIISLEAIETPEYEYLMSRGFILLDSYVEGEDAD